MAQPVTIGDIVENWTPRPHPLSNPQHHILQGQYCRLEVLTSTNDIVIQQLYDAFKPTEETHFKYLGYGPFKTVDEFKQFIYMKEQPSGSNVLYAIFVNDMAVGFITYLRISEEHGTIEIGSVNLTFGTFGYRRVVWSCNALNMKSRVAALRFGFQYEGTWMKAEVSKGRSRDTALFSIVDDEWSQIKEEFQRWLNPENFDINGQQLTKLNGAKVNPRHHKITDSS
ncbi:unnamed protein product [Rotaria magnacalcarata]|uniref:N-acetyltransferase domain-containing protein n=1 Tax=Rotaria magnacalcarata TaxID=392030 RepID=A0A816MTQ6_9BILA|nr:unnamed protein product [Rotaria magnacalcarata]CAF1667872.1 unnamed protein product [Rotaria magnacalcarata]CAF2006910.1 unnamed protein product [Rotaria magnacalcarata]CAF4126784.1 unnamed protein product [Rotaria magnacalcarata]CAF4309654.1 unnamed protein product [Rotaria magnacalcarata]